MNARKQYIHYGSDKYDPKEVKKIYPAIYSKPDTGIWASPVESDWGWSDWCMSNEWGLEKLKKHFIFTLSSKAKILEIHDEEDLIPYIITGDRLPGWPRFAMTDICDHLNREKVYKEFDGIEVFLSENYSMHDGMLNAWDCDSIVIWNPDVIVPFT